MLNSSKKTISIIGAGKLGKALAQDIIKYKIGCLTALCNSSAESSQHIINELNAPILYAPLETLPSSHFVFITTPDSLIEYCANQLSKNLNLLPGTIVVHCSGVLNTDVLSALKSKGCLLASLHPVRSFSLAKGTTFANAYCALEGDEQALTALKDLLRPLTLKWLSIDREKKATYHSGAVFAANYLISVLHQAQQAYQVAGLSNDVAFKVSCDLAQSVLDNIKKTNSLAKSLTGPLARGDIETIKQHLNPMPKPTQQLYQHLALNLLDLCELSDEKKTQLKTVLSDETTYVPH
tara:strand:- start:95 stop:976 length:882 start_codon:yes stop_codon:yes gene_type:complete